MSYPPPGGIAAPDYGRPPRKNRAGLFIALMLILLVAVLGTGVYVATKVVSSIKPDPSTPPPAPVTSVAPPPKPTASVKPKPTTTVRTVPVKPVPVTTRPAIPPAGGPGQLAQRFVAKLNANDPTGAAAFACAGSKQLIPTLMQTQLRPPTALQVGTVVGQKLTFVFPLSGKTKGATVTGVVVIHDLGSEPLCVRAFAVNPQ